MTRLAPTLEAFFTDRLLRQRQASAHTITAYRDAFRLLLAFLQHRTGTPASRLDLADLDASAINAFLAHLEAERHNSVATRNARLAAVHSLFRFAALRHPEHAELIAHVLAIPPKRKDRAIVAFLNDTEVDALLASPDRSSWIGRRDHLILTVALDTGLRVSELVGLTGKDALLHGPGPAHLRCVGKGRKERVTPLLQPTAALLRSWVREQRTSPDDPLFPTSTGHRLSPDAVQRRLEKYLATARQTCPSLHGKRLTPHVLRHTCAVTLLRAGVDISIIALLLGHETIRTTQTYLEADLTLKERALARTTPRHVKAGRYRPPDPLLAFLESL
jgi:site-specific recombinase XerD